MPDHTASISARSADPLTGGDLLAHHAQADRFPDKGALVLAAGFIRPRSASEPLGSPPRPSFTAYYEALINARNGEHNRRRRSPGQLPIPQWADTDHAGARRAVVLHWRPAQRNQPEPATLPPGLTIPLPDDDDERNAGFSPAVVSAAWHHVGQVRSHCAPPEQPLAACLSDGNGLLAVAVLSPYPWGHGTPLRQTPEQANNSSTTSISNPEISSSEQEAYQCPECSGMFDPFRDEPATIDGARACPDCADDADTCNHCGAPSFDADGQPCPDCRDGLTQCSECGAWEEDTRTTHADPSCSWGETEVCADCVERNLQECNWHVDDDGDIVRQEQPSKPGWSDALILHRYGTDPHTILRQAVPDIASRATYGAELEYDSPPYDVPSARQLATLSTIATQDGSLDNAGAELVTAALTAGEMRRNLSQLATITDGAETHIGTGLHFHIDKRRADPYLLFHLAHYLKRWQSLIIPISGRKATSYQNLSLIQGETLTAFCRNYHQPDPSTCRYAAVNCRNTETIEFRFCQNSTDKVELLARFDLIRLLMALLTVPKSAWPSTPEAFQSFLAHAPGIRELKGIEPTEAWRFRVAHAQPWHAEDLPPWRRNDRESVEARARAIAAIRYASDLQTRTDARQAAATILRNPYDPMHCN